MIWCSMLDAAVLFRAPVFLEEIFRRVFCRGALQEQKIRHRLETVRDDEKEIVNYDYIVVNDTVDRAVGEILAILIAEGCRKERRLHLVEGV